ncbi:MAG: SH3 domain-containing protein, partial [Caldilineaceae bacterium]|nr:SH3 domain-containing protein [Caldilineaceae bacterium]
MDSRLNVRAAPVSGAEIVGKLPAGAEVEILGASEDDEWLEVRLEGIVESGWVATEFVEVVDLEAIAETETQESGEQAASLLPTPTPGVPLAIIQPERMNVRAGPGTAYEVVTAARQGVRLEITGLSPAGDWYQVKIDEQDQPGWVFAGLTETVGRMETVEPVSEDELPPTPTPGPASEAAAVVAASSAASEQVSAPIVSAPPPSGSGFFGYGLQAHMLGGGIGEALNATSDLGFDWIKQQVEWRLFQSGPGGASFGELQGIVNEAGNRGINVLFSVVNAPAWAREPGHDSSVGGPPADRR